MTPQQHDAQRALVLASERATHHPDVYAKRASLQRWEQTWNTAYAVDAKREPMRPRSERRHGAWS